MGYRFFMLNILAFTLTLNNLSADAQPIPPISIMTPPSVSTPGQHGQDEKLTLDRAVDFAMRHHPLIRAAASGREIVDAQLGEAQAGHWPLFQFSEIFTHSNNPVFVFGSLLEQSRVGPQNLNI